jgi:Predicted transcriptional regulators
MIRDQRFIEIGRRIKLRRKELHIKQYELAEEVEVSNNHVSAIENGREKPSIDLLMDLCEKLEVTPDYFLLGNIHANNIPLNIIDNLRLCSEDDIDFISRVVAFLAERNINNFNKDHYA